MKENRAALIDEYGELQRLFAGLAPQAKRLKALSKTLQGWYADEDAEKSFIALGAAYELHVSERENRRSVLDIPRLFTHVGKTKFLEACSITLEAVERLVPVELRDVFIGQARTGPRTLQTVARAPVAIDKGRRKAA